MGKLRKALRKKYKGVNSIFISSFVPRKCGIATYTSDLTNAMDLISPLCEPRIVALNKPEDGIEYPPKVVFEINQDDVSSYKKAAAYINRSRADVVVLEHEFGLYGGKFGEYINELV
ncbi:MAG: glycosyl transferase family 1, partial [Actinomycetota bacterium]|nr:glycosyl transferase family 1 [Actinomycetota bacterium]